MKKVKLLILVLAIIAVAIFAVYRMTGIYVDPPVPPKYAGETVWFYRRLINAPFLFSADSVALQNGAVPTVETRQAVSQNVNNLLSRHVIHRFAFNRSLYLKTTGNRDFVNPKP